MDLKIFAASMGGAIALSMIGAYRQWRANRKSITLEQDKHGEYVDSIVKWERRGWWVYLAVIFVMVTSGLYALMRAY